ncbi:MAG: transposase [Desulfobacteraceae bacterium]|jgi:REP element-mobilizing transposase RayT
MTKIRRKNIRLPSRIYENPSQIFSITICTWRRAALFKYSKYANSLIETLNNGLFIEKAKRFAYCLMPDHLHLLVSPRQGSLIDLISRWKSFSANRLRQKGLASRCWQRGFYDHALRREEEVKSTAEYIVNNPIRAGLVRHWQDYPYSWHMWMS